MPELVSAYRKDTGAKVLIPAHWFDIPNLAAPFRKTPRQRAEDQKKNPPTAPAAGDKKE